MNNKTRTSPTVILLLILFSAVMLAYFLGIRKGDLGLSNISNQAPVVDQDPFKNLVNNFYSALESQKGELLFSYLTPPLTAQEKVGFNWLTGADLGQDAFYRVFLRARISNPRIDDTQKINDNTVVVRVTDQTSGYSNARNIGWSSPKPRYDMLLTIIKSEDKWMVDKFTDTSAKTGTEKYSGFGQGY